VLVAARGAASPAAALDAGADLVVADAAEALGGPPLGLVAGRARSWAPARRSGSVLAEGRGRGRRRSRRCAPR
jgi:hypothetical protein